MYNTSGLDITAARDTMYKNSLALNKQKKLTQKHSVIEYDFKRVLYVNQFYCMKPFCVQC